MGATASYLEEYYTEGVEKCPQCGANADHDINVHFTPEQINARANSV